MSGGVYEEIFVARRFNLRRGLPASRITKAACAGLRDSPRLVSEPKTVVELRRGHRFGKTT
jgi:hypothetical protein